MHQVFRFGSNVRSNLRLGSKKQTQFSAMKFVKRPVLGSIATLLAVQGTKGAQRGVSAPLFCILPAPGSPPDQKDPFRLQHKY